MAHKSFVVAAALLGACLARDRANPSDDPADYSVDTGVVYDLVVSEPRWVVPSAALPPQTPPMASNNNMDIELFDGRLFLAWRTSETHFASTNTKLYVVSSADEGVTFEHELTVALDSDAREPRFAHIGGVLHFYFFQAGTDFFTFSPKAMYHTQRLGKARWAELATFGEPGEVLWDLKLRGDRLLLTSYVGNHYAQGDSAIDVIFRSSTDGVTWAPVDPARPVAYHGGVSEVAYEFAADGTLWAVTRNEDGDDTGFGSHVCSAAPSALASWQCSPQSDPQRYDSPKMIRHGNNLYLIGRRDIGGPFDEELADLSFAEQKTQYALDYWNRPKRTAIYRVDTRARKVVHLLDLPSDGDTAYPAVRRTGPHTFLLANYTSPLGNPDRSWLVGQTSTEGTQIYFVELRFVPR